MNLPLSKLINSLVWIICGVLVIAIRLWILRSASVLVWETLGIVMIAYGTGRLLWVLVRVSRANPSIP